MQRVQGFAEQGNTSVLTMGHVSTNVVQGSFPYATITVFVSGSTSLATLYGDNHTTPTPLANPFTADENGYWFFYAANGRYDVRFSGQNISCPWTLGDILIEDPSVTAGSEYNWTQNVYANGFSLIGASDVNTACVTLTGTGPNPGPMFICADVNGNIQISDHAASGLVWITQAGNVGIGTSVPNAALEVQRYAPGATAPTLRLSDIAGGVGSGAAIAFNSTSAATALPDGQIQVIDMGTWSVDMTFSTKVPGAVANPLEERMRITSDGNIGIGTSQPNAALEIRRDVAAGLGPTLLLSNAAGGAGAGASIAFNSTGGGNNPDGQILAMDAGNWSVDLAFATKQPGAYANPMVERMRLTSGGRLGIGTSPASDLHITGSPTLSTILLGHAAGPDVAGVLLWNNTTGGHVISAADFFLNAIFDEASGNDWRLADSSHDAWSISLTSSDIPGNSSFQVRYMTFGTSVWVPYVWITAAGNVGLGVNNPTSYRLDVAGDVNVTGAFRINGVPLDLSGTAAEIYNWSQNVNAHGFQLLGAGKITVAGDVDITGQYMVNGQPLSFTPPPISSSLTAGVGISFSVNAGPPEVITINATNPTTTLGDLIVRGATALDRLPIGTDGQVLIANSAASLGMAWTSPAAVSVPVTSVFTRIGDVVAAAGDYDATLITVSPAVSGWNNVQTAIEGLNSGLSSLTTASVDWSRIINAPVFITGVAVQSAGTPIATQPTLNFVDTASATWSVVNDAANNRITFSIAATGAGYLPDPTTTLGDLIVRAAGPGVTRLPVGTNGQVLTADSAATLGMAWTSPPVTSVFGRIDNVVAVAGDYTANLITLSPAIGSWTTVQQALAGLDTNVNTASVAWTRITGAPTFVDTAGSYTDPTWLTINWSKLNGNPTPAQVGYMQTPWLQNIDAASYGLANASRVSIGVATSDCALDVKAADFMVARLRGGQAGTNNTQLRFWGNLAAEDLWVIGTDVPFPTGGSDFFIYDMALWPQTTAAAVTIQQFTNFVGLNMVTPQCQLDVNGDIQASGSLIFRDPALAAPGNMMRLGLDARGFFTVFSYDGTPRVYTTPGGRIFVTPEFTAETGVLVDSEGMELGFMSKNSHQWGKPGYVIENDAKASLYLWIAGSQLDTALLPETPHYSNNVIVMASHDITFHVNTTPPASGEAMRITKAGRIGMGAGGTVKDPQYQLEVQGSINIRDPGSVGNYGFFVNGVAAFGAFEARLEADEARIRALEARNA